MGNYLTSTRTVEKHVHVKPTRKPTNEKGRPSIKFEDLPEDVLCTILSKLPAKEVVRTSVLSSEWRYIWTTCPKLSFNGIDVCSRRGGKQHTQMFIDRVNAVLQKHHGKVANDLEIKFIFESKLVEHLNNWISFAMSSRIKNLAFDLAPPTKLLTHGDQYIFPFELLDKESVSCLECLQLSFICFKLPPSEFIGFPNLRKLDLHLLKTPRHVLEDILCSCCNLEWLSIVRCHLKNELKVVRPLSQLQYLRVMHCEITKIELHAAKLSTFEYTGPCIPIALHHASKLENAKFFFSCTTFQHGVATLVNGLPEVQNLTLQFSVPQLETQWMLDSPHMFTQLRHVQILFIIPQKDFDKILYVVSFLRVAPSIEKLEVHFFGNDTLWFDNSGPFRQEIPIPPCEYTHLKNIHVTGFRGARGQVEFLEHMVENAPSIEVVTVDTAQRLADVFCPDKINLALNCSALDMIRGPLLKRLPPRAKLLLFQVRGAHDVITREFFESFLYKQEIP